MISSRWFTPSVLGLVLCVTSIISVWIYGPRAARFDGVCLLHTGLRRAGIRTSTCTTAQLDGMLKAWRAEELSSWQLASALAAPTTGLQEGFDRSVSGRLTAAPKERAYDLVLANLLAQARLKLQHLADTHEKRQNRTVLPIKRELARLQGRERAGAG